MIENILDNSIGLINSIDVMFLFFQQNLSKLRQKIIKTSIVKLPPDDMDSGVEDFYIESTLYNFTSNGNEPMIFVTMNNGSDMDWEFVVLHLSVNQENFTSCTNPLDESGSQCHATDDGDGYWSQGETITIREGNENLCDGSHNCNVQIKISESYINVSPIPNMIFESLNRSGVESVVANETGWINLNDHRSDIIIHLSNSADMGATIDRSRYTTPCHKRQMNQRNLKMASVASDD